MHAGGDPRKDRCRLRRATAEPGDAAACNALSRQVHGFDRGVELVQGIAQGSARVVERGNRITGYTTHLAFFGHSTAETNVDLQALIASAESFAGALGSYTFKKSRSVSLVRSERPARGATIDAHEHRIL